MDGEWNEREYLEIPSRRALFVGVIRSSRSKFAGAAEKRREKWKIHE